MTCKLSVVIPLYNKAYSIKKTLQSVLDQSKPVDEIIIIDDGSTDDSATLVQELVDSNSAFNIHLIQQQNAGVSAARNLGMQKAQCDYVALLDADDEWDPDFVLEMTQLIKKCPQASMYSCFHRVKDDKGHLYTSRNNVPPGFADYINNYHHVATSGTELVRSSAVILNRSDALSIGGFPTDAVITEDLFLWSRMAIKFKYAFLNKTLVQANQCLDESRAARTNKMPYLLVFYKQNPSEFKSLTQEQKNYLFSIHFKHILGSLALGNYPELMQRLKLGSSLFRLRNAPVWFLLAVPYPIFTLMKHLKRKLFSQLHA